MLVLTELVRIADKLDKHGLYEESSQVDAIIKSAVEEDLHALFDKFMNYFGKMPTSIDELHQLKENTDDYGKELAEAFWDKLVGPTQMPKYEKGPTRKVPSTSLTRLPGLRNMGPSDYLSHKEKYDPSVSPKEEKEILQRRLREGLHSV